MNHVVSDAGLASLHQAHSIMSLETSSSSLMPMKKGSSGKDKLAGHSVIHHIFSQISKFAMMYQS